MKKIGFAAKRFTITAEDVWELEANYLAVPASHASGLYRALVSVSDLLDKYEKLILIFPPGNLYPASILKAFLQYCQRHQKNYAIHSNATDEIPAPGTGYLTLAETDLAALIKISRRLRYELGQDMGILSFDDSRVKELMGLTVLTAAEAGNDNASLLLQPACQSTCAGPVNVIRRSSL
ncbi:type 1 periplasmic-binding domain-containing protein [Pontibacter beigongshangensis]|uniref:hypothetical protein n=1 Tax=Pontibacter beigongshangensis TaxID=2574733 RepID=UPI00164F2DD0|nr:hypothetical protein [Pontibacter beigongshangensis]